MSETQLKESLLLQLQQQRMLHDKLEQQRDWSLKNMSISNNLSGLQNFQGLQRNIPVPRSDKMRQNNNVNKYLLGIMRQQQQYQQQLNSGGINSTQQQQMVQPLQQTGSLNLSSQFRANGTLNTQERVTPAQLRQILSLQDAVAATQEQNAGLIQNGQPGVMQNATSPQPWFKQMPVIDYRNSSLDRLQRQQQQSPRMVGPGDQKSVCLTGSQPDDATPGGRSSHGTEGSNQFIRKGMIHDVVSQLNLNGNMDPEVEDLVFEIAGNLIDSVTTLACTLAKHPKSSTSDSKDVLLHPGGSKQEKYSKSSDPEMRIRCNETIPGILKRMNAQDGTINHLKIRYRELCMALVICVLVMLFMLWDRLVQG